MDTNINIYSTKYIQYENIYYNDSIGIYFLFEILYFLV
jgi:hypothetical protein